jgi:hypothetical protein
MTNQKGIDQLHIDQLLDSLDTLLAIPELQCFEELHDESSEAILRANVVRRGVRDELAFMADD